MKMRTVASFAFVLAIIVFCTGCSGARSGSTIESGLNEAGNFYSTSEMGDTEFAGSLPFAISYNGSNVFIKDVSAYEVQTSNYAYTLYVVIDIDASELDDAGFHWLREEDLSVSAYITSEKNEYDFDAAYRLGSLSSGKTISFVFMSSPLDKCRHSFANGKVTVSASLAQEDTYEYKREDGTVGNLHKENTGMYEFELPDELPSAETIPEPLYGYVVEWLAEKAKSYS